MDAVNNTPHSTTTNGSVRSIPDLVLSPTITSADLKSIAGELVEHWNSVVAFELSQATASSQLDFKILATRYEPTPTNLQQWATRVALKSLMTGAAIVDSTPDKNAGLLHMISTPGDSGNAFVCLFINGSEDFSAELSTLQSVFRSTTSNSNSDGQNSPNAICESSTGAIEIAEDVAAIQSLSGGIGAAKTLKASCQKMANTLAKHLLRLVETPSSPATVFVATLDRAGKPDLVAASDSDSISPTITEPIEAAMAECLSRRCATHWPPIDDQRHALLCHQRLATELETANVASFILSDTKGENQAVLLVTSDAAPGTRCHRFLDACTEPFGATLSLVRRAEQNRLQRWISSIGDAFAKKRTRSIAKCLAAVFLVGLIPLPYQIWTDCEVQPTSKQFVCAPFDTKIKECFVEPGDFLEAGQPVAQLDNSEIQLELAEVTAEYHRVLKKRDGFVASHDSGEAGLAHHETEMLRAKNDLLKHRADNLELKSPITGVVIAGDLKDSIGMPVQQGQSLFEIAPLTAFTIDVFIPQSDIRYAKTGMPVRVSLDAFPFESWDGVIKRVHPASEIHGQNNVFVATVEIEDGVEQLRPGMEGSATISSVWRPIWWNLLHKPAAKCLRYAGW